MTPSSRNESGFLWVEQGEEKIGPVAEVAPLLNIDRTYTFAVPAALADSVRVGHRVMIPLRKKGTLTPGFVLRIDQGSWDSTLRPIDSVVDPEAFLTPELVELGRQIGHHYCCPLGPTLKAMTPEAVRARRGFKRVRFVELCNDAIHQGPKLTPRQQKVVDFLSAQSALVAVSKLLQESETSSAVLRGMERKGLVRVQVREESQAISGQQESVHQSDPDFELNSDQRRALGAVQTAIAEQLFRVLVLFGVSGSGKTEVYVRAIRNVIASGRQAIFLVPEIVLTTQLANRLAARFPAVAIQHSGLTESQRAVIWREIASGRRSVVVGTRSAVFAPCPELGLIVVDEEQEGSYKNLQSPRFHVRDVAIMRAKQHGIPIVLGSATPSLETWHRGRTRGDYQLIEMPRRVKELPMPAVHIVDMREEIIEQKKIVPFSRTMERLLSETLVRGEQAIILMNRRGFASRAFCEVCKSRLSCPNCSTGLVVHATSGESVCHYCCSRMPTPARCPRVGCGGTLVHVGLGTQKVEQLIRQRFPSARVLRVDSDAVHKREHYEQLVADFGAHKIDVLVGTQMIAKGLDFPLVSFVGMMHTESDGFAGDFRAHERLFQLVTQVAGRSGRESVPGQVVIQTLTPDLPALTHALGHDFPGFAHDELVVRHQLRLPPFSRLARLVVSHEREETARNEARLLAEKVQQVIASIESSQADIIGPNPSPMARLHKRYRYDFLLRAPHASELHKVLVQLRSSKALRVHSARLVIDVDPVSLA